MARPKKDGKHLNLYIKRELMESFDQYCEAVGQAKTVAMERMMDRCLKEYFNKPEKERVPW